MGSFGAGEVSFLREIIFFQTGNAHLLGKERHRDILQPLTYVIGVATEDQKDGIGGPQRLPLKVGVIYDSTGPTHSTPSPQGFFGRRRGPRERTLSSCCP